MLYAISFFFSPSGGSIGKNKAKEAQHTCKHTHCIHYKVRAACQSNPLLPFQTTQQNRLLLPRAREYCRPDLIPGGQVRVEIRPLFPLESQRGLLTLQNGHPPFFFVDFTLGFRVRYQLGVIFCSCVLWYPRFPFVVVEALLLLLLFLLEE